jgi:hypothetical protein
VTNRRQWLVVALLFLATVLNYVDRQTLSVLAEVLEEATANWPFF